MDIGGIANVITALGTIGMLIFLAIQIRDNTRVMQASALGSMLQNARERTVGLLCDNAEVSDIVARGTDSLENLSEQERFRFLFFMTDMALHMQHVVELLDAKLISQTDHDGWLQWTSAVFRTHGATALWPQLVPVLRAPVRKRTAMLIRMRRQFLKSCRFFGRAGFLAQVSSQRQRTSLRETPADARASPCRG
jgi:hypothetical protein